MENFKFANDYIAQNNLQNTLQAIAIKEFAICLDSQVINKPVQTTKEQPKTYCKAKSGANNPGLPECDCHNFCKFDDIQFDTSLG
jgi:ribonuclease I